MNLASETDNKTHRILVVEDSKLNRIVVMQMLKRVGVSNGEASHAGAHAARAEIGIVGREASGARQAIDMLIAEPFDLVLMDIQMPEMDGLAATRAIRAGEAGDHNREIPIIAMTAYSTAEDEAACYAAGMSAYLAKPLSVQKFITTIRSALDD